MAVEEELKRDHAEMQAVIDAKQKIIDAQVLQMTMLTSMISASELEWEFRDHLSLLSGCEELACVLHSGLLWTPC